MLSLIVVFWVKLHTNSKIICSVYSYTAQNGACCIVPPQGADPLPPSSKPATAGRKII